MSDKTGIQWTEATWNPVTGCTKVSAGCKHCYAKHQAWPRLKATPGSVYFGREFEDVRFHPERLDQPLRWTKPRRIFVNSMSDLFHEDVTDEQLDQMFAVMAEASWHVFQVLTKRPQRMHDYLAPGEARRQIVDRVACKMHQSGEIRMREDAWLGAWPLPNVWLGVSVEDQETADERIPVLLNTPAAVRWISAEPLLGPIDLTNIELPARYALSITTAAHVNALTASDDEHFYNHHASLNWCVVGGESGVDARPMHPDWARSLRDQCAAAKVPFFFKQWGDCRQVAGKFPEKKAGHIARDGTHIRDVVLLDPNETLAHRLEAALNDGKWHWAWMEHVGKKAAGRALDGREWNEYPA